MEEMTESCEDGEGDDRDEGHLSQYDLSINQSMYWWFNVDDIYISVELVFSFDPLWCWRINTPPVKMLI